ncbi:hypothetical protein QYE76_019618 [Lolium multiflorum]|uniref:Uncharacterized protein n=2 Tax=Lolium multiflorum TaxID=4521 RepID=A0AAD8R383_LOLMU|nr:hypothetical protein QYE76_019617 [Lolium multiflorum]KAK1614101.1 hypothetical protein QYE76_019618 [Lolium multiflorum]
MADGGGSADWLPIYDRVEAMLSKSQAEAEAEALAADRARLEAADRVHRESREAVRMLQRTVEELQATAREKDVEMDRLREEAADAKKKLQEVRQADVSRRGRWEAAYLDLLLGANQRLTELRDGDLEDSRTCAGTPNPKEVGSCSRLSQNMVDHIGSDLRTELRKLKQAYETLSSNKDQEVSELVAEKDSVSKQLSRMHQDYANKKVEAALATEAALKLQQSVDELKVLAQKKDDEIARLQAEAVGAKMNLRETHSLVKEKDDETPRHKIRQPVSVLRPIKDSNETHKKSRSDDPAVSGKSRNNVGKDGQDETSQKRRRVSSTSDRQHTVRQHYGSTSAPSFATSLAKLIVADQQSKLDQRLPGHSGRGRGRGRLVGRRRSCDQAEIGGQIEVQEEEKQQPEEEQSHQRAVAQPCEQLPSMSAAAAAGLIKLKEVKQQPS